MMIKAYSPSQAAQATIYQTTTIRQYKQCYLESYGLYNDINDKMLNNLIIKENRFENEFQSDRYCPICLIEKPFKTRHVKKVNLCVKEFQFYSHIFDKIVFYKNTKIYLLICLLHLLTLTVEIAKIICSSSDIFTFHPLFYVIEYFISKIPLQLKFIIAINILILLSWTLDTCILLIATYYALTIDELMNPQHYPYLFRKIEKGYVYHNPSNKCHSTCNFNEVLTR